MSWLRVFKLITRLKMICDSAPGQPQIPKLRAVVEKVGELAASGRQVRNFTQAVDRIPKELQRPWG